MSADNPNLFSQATKVAPAQRERLLGQHSQVIWFTGLSGSGKSTLAVALEKALHERGNATFLLDGDNLRQGLNRDLGFDEVGRVENIRRVGEVSALMADAGLVVITAFISPFRSDRELARNTIGKERFYEVFCDCPLEICEQRDVKGLYHKAREGKVAHFTGISSGYEAPQKPNMIIKTSEWTVEHSVNLLIEQLTPRLSIQ